jgi:hypothetical protein
MFIQHQQSTSINSKLTWVTAATPTVPTKINIKILLLDIAFPFVEDQKYQRHKINIKILKL